MADDLEPVARPPSPEAAQRSGALPPGRVAVRIEGLTSDWCGRRLAAILADVPGVGSVRLDLLTETATVEAARIRSGDLIEAVRRAGYDAVAGAAVRSGGVEAGDTDRLEQQRLREQRQALVTAVGMGLPIIGLQWAAPVLGGTHVGAHFWPTALQALLVLLLYLSPAGGPLLAGGFRALLHRLPSQDLLISIGLLMAAAGGLASMLAMDRVDLNHFPTAALALIIIHIGRYIELKLRLRLAGSGVRTRYSDPGSEPSSRPGVGDRESAPEDGFSPSWLAETAAALLVPAAIAVAGVAGVVWSLLGSINVAVAVTMAALLAASPRGIGLVVPAAAAAMRHGGGEPDAAEPALRRAAWQNLVIAGIISDGGVLLAVLGLLPPGLAPVFMVGASLAVLANSLRLRRAH